MRSNEKPRPWSRSPVDSIPPNLRRCVRDLWTETGSQDFLRDETEERIRIATHRRSGSCSFWDKRRVSSAQIDREMNKGISRTRLRLSIHESVFDNRRVYRVTQRIRRCQTASDMLDYLPGNSSSATGAQPQISRHVRIFHACKNETGWKFLSTFFFQIAISPNSFRFGSIMFFLDVPWG